jgi:hypothetical protein
MASEDLRARLREQPAPVRYDVARGLARHRALVDANAPLPDWARELPAPRGRWLRRAAWWAGAAVVLTGLWATPTPVERAATPAGAPPRSARASAPRPVEPVVVGTHAPTPHAEPVVEASPARGTDVVIEPAREENARAHGRARPRVRPRSAPEPAPESGSAAVHAAPVSARTVVPEENRELAQLVEAERALKSEPVRALRLAREGELSFRNGYFAQERRYVEVMALFALGRLAEAHAKSAAFLRDYPAAPYRRKVELELLRQPQH